MKTTRFLAGLPLEKALRSSPFPIEGCEVKGADTPLLTRRGPYKPQDHARRARQTGKAEAAAKRRCGLYSSTMKPALGDADKIPYWQGAGKVSLLTWCPIHHTHSKGRQMYSHEDKMRAIELYLRYDWSAAAVMNELGGSFLEWSSGISDAISNNFALQMLKSESMINSLFDGRNLSRVDAGVVIDRIPS